MVNLTVERRIYSAKQRFGILLPPNPTSKPAGGIFGRGVRAKPQPTKPVNTPPSRRCIGLYHPKRPLLPLEECFTDRCFDLHIELKAFHEVYDDGHGGSPGWRSDHLSIRRKNVFLSFYLTYIGRHGSLPILYYKIGNLLSLAHFQVDASPSLNSILHLT